MHFIGVVGRAGSGKDTFCNLCIQALTNHGVPAKKIAFAHKIKEILAELYGHPSAFFGTQAEKEKEIFPGWTGRKIKQHVGEKLKEVNERVWIEYALKTAQEHQIKDGTKVIFFSDLRFLMEAATVRTLGGPIVRIKRPSVDNEKNVGIPGHRSETELELIKPDYIIDNSREELSELKQFASDFLRKVGLL